MCGEEEKPFLARSWIAAIERRRRKKKKKKEEGHRTCP